MTHWAAVGFILSIGLCIGLLVIILLLGLLFRIGLVLGYLYEGRYLRSNSITVSNKFVSR